MKVTVQLNFRGSVIQATFEGVNSINQAIADFWSIVKEEEGVVFVVAAKKVGQLTYWEEE